MIIPRVGIDLAPASRGSTAPGTARHVTEQARTLFAMDLPWTWVPLVEGKENPLWEEIQHLRPVVVSRQPFWLRASTAVGDAWRKENCSIGFATAYFVPWRGVPVVANFFDSNVFEHGDTWIQSGRRWNYYLIRALSTLALYRADRLFINSEYCRKVIDKKFPSASSKLVVAPCGVRSPMRGAADRPLWAKDLRTYFLYVGIFSENKNQRRLLEAWARLQQQHLDLPDLVLVGSCDSAYRSSAIQPALEKLRRPERVMMMQGIPDAELAWLYQNATAYLQPSIAEGFGLPVIEAMSYGLPVACSNTTSLPEVAGAAAIQFDPSRVASIEEACSRLWHDSSLRNTLSKMALQRYTNYTWQQNAGIVTGEIEAMFTRLN